MRKFHLVVVATTTSLISGALWGAQPSLTTLYTFQDIPGGVNPFSGVIPGPNGSLYGTTQFGGTGAGGTIYQLLPPAKAGMPWTKTTLYSFQFNTNSSDGFNPWGNLVADSSGNLYGTTQFGGGFHGGTFINSALQFHPAQIGRKRFSIHFREAVMVASQ